MWPSAAGKYFEMYPKCYKTADRWNNPASLGCSSEIAVSHNMPQQIFIGFTIQPDNLVIVCPENQGEDCASHHYPDEDA